MSDATARFAMEMYESCGALRIRHLHRIILRRYDEALGAVGLTLTQLEVLGVLAALGPCRVGRLAEVTMTDRSTMSRNLAVLEREGFVEPASTTPTGRTRDVALTDAGRASFLAGEEHWRGVHEFTATVVGADGLALLDRWIDGLRDDNETMSRRR